MPGPALRIKLTATMVIGYDDDGHVLYRNGEVVYDMTASSLLGMVTRFFTPARSLPERRQIDRGLGGFG